MCPESSQAPQECCLRVSLTPLRLNIDQVKIFSAASNVSNTFSCFSNNRVVSFFGGGVSLKDALFFLKDFFTSLATEVEFFSTPSQEG